MHGRRTFIGLAAAAIITTAAIPAPASQLQFLKIGSGSPGGNYFPIAGLIAQVISNPPGARSCQDGGNCGVPGLVATAQSTGGSVANVDALYQGQIELGLSQSDVAYWSYTATGPFKSRPPNDRICAITSLYEEQVHVLAAKGSGIGAITDVKGKRVALGKRDSGALLGAMLVLQAHGINARSDLTPVLVDFASAQQQFKAGQVDAFVTVTGYPNDTIAVQTKDLGATLVPISGAGRDALTTQSPFYTKSRIPGGTYPQQTGDVETAAVPALLLSSQAVNQETVYGITKALWRNPHARKILDNGHTRGVDITVETAFDGVSIPLCPGAEKFYGEIGMTR